MRVVLTLLCLLISGAGAGVASVQAAASEPRLIAPFITGSTVYSVRDLEPTFHSQLGQGVSPVSLEAIRSAIRERYLQGGYFAPVITIPEEDLDSSTPRLQIFEAELRQVVIKGDSGPNRSLIDGYMRELQRQPVIKRVLSQACLQRIAALPGITLSASFERHINTVNQYTLILNISYQAVGGSLTTNNRGTHGLGRQLFAGQISLNGLLGWAENVKLEGATSNDFDRYRTFGGQLVRQFAGTQVSLGVSGSHATFDSNTRYTGRSASLAFEHSLTTAYALSSHEISFDILGSFQSDDSTVRSQNHSATTADKVRSVELGFAGHSENAGVKTSGYLAAAHGLRALGASSLDEIAFPSALAFTKALANLEQSREFGHWRWRLDFNAQWTEDKLPASEKLTFGGSAIGRAFDPGSLVGDSGALASTEIDRLLDWHSRLISYVILYAQADYGIVWNNAAYLPARDDAASLTAGLTTKLDPMLVSVELSKPLHQASSISPAESTRAFFSLRYPF